MYYQPYDCAHIEPYNEEDHATNSFYNLIALCKNCHWKTEPKHSNAIITAAQLKALKLHWMIASGRFTRLEIDAISQTYDGLESSKKYPWIRMMLRLEDVNGKELRIIHPWVYITLSLNAPLYKNLIDLKFIRFVDSRSIIADNDISFNPVYFYLTEPGLAFCKNFHEAYQELDKIEI